MSQFLVQRLALIGCGLMGGSFALALRAAGLVAQVQAFSPSLATRQKALSLGVIDLACDDLASAVRGADVVLLALPVGATLAAMQAVARHLDDQALLMDVGSTKCDVVAAARSALGAETLAHFVPAHPVAGMECSGVEHAVADLYQQRQVYLTPVPETESDFTHRAQELWRALGARVAVVSPEFHDAAFAAVSHLPHLLSFAFINALLAQQSGPDWLKMGGPGFRDFSRIAASDPVLWRDVFLANKTHILDQLAHTREALTAFESALQQGNATELTALIESARQARTAWRMAGTTTTANS